MRTTTGRPTRALFLLGVSAFALGALPAAAQSPQGGTVASGAARISQTARQSTIRQTSERAVIDWKSFDVGRTHRVVFDQPGKSSATLNRVNSVSKSVIQGSITAPGTVIIQNTAGVLFSKGAKLDVGGLVATSQTVDAARFQQGGGLSIGGGERPGARVVNEGEVTIGEKGLAALVGGNVENAGAIYARTGTVALASGTRTTIDLSGDGAIQIAVGGNPAEGGVVNSGLIDAGAGRVLLTAGDAASAIDSVINTTGVIRAGSSSGSGGRIELIGRGSGKVRIGGTVSASGATGGGSVAITGESVAVAGAARIGARGGQDGGTVRIGGDLRGKGPLRRADHVAIAEGAVITATGETGRGGSVVAWADGTTIFDGRIAAEGGAGGGLVETSGKFALAIGPMAAVSTGAGGTWLLDPRNVEIDNGGAAVSPGVNNPPDGPGIWTVDTNSLRQALNAGGNVVITTDADGTTPGNPGNSDGDIVFRRALNWTGSGDLTLLADGDVVFDASVSTKDGDFIATAGEDLRITNAIQSSGTGDLVLTAGEAIAIDADVRATGTGSIAMLARKGDIVGTWRPAGNLRVTTRSGDLDLEASQGSVILRRFNTSSGDNIQVFSDSGDLTVTAGYKIRIQGESTGGRWVRLGSSGSSGDVTLTAPTIKVFGGSADNTFAEVAAGEGGSITMNAETIWLRNGVSEGRVAALNRADLAMRAETQIWDGPVRAGTGGDNGGNVALSGAITALVEPLFGLAANRTFVLEPTTPGGAPSSYGSSVRLGVSTSGTGSIEIGAPVEAAQIALISQERVGIGAGAGLRATGAGDSLVVAAGRRFRNDAGTDALETTAGGARWLLYIDGFDGLVGAEPASGNFDLYGRLFADTPPSLVTYGGNRIIYGERPVLTITGETLDKTYGTAVTPGLTVAGLRPGDSLGTALATGPDVASDGAAATAAVGSYATDVTATPSDQGYRLDLVDGVLTVDPALLTITADDKSRIYGSANPPLTASYSGFVLGQDASVLGGSLTTTATQGSDAGRYTITGDTLTSRNYAITSTDGTMTVGKAALSVVANDASRPEGSANPPFTATISGFVLDQSIADLGGELAFATPATPTSPAGSYGITPEGLASRNYAITYVDGLLTVTPGGAQPQPQAPAPFGIAGAAERFERGVPPLTPGDATFRTTIAEAPPALADPFLLTYSLGDVVQYVPAASAAPAGADAQGFVPASGGLAEGGLAQGGSADCSGPINRAGSEAGCTRQTFAESFWTTRAEESQ
ncbi:MAG: filamentous hemagglutinin N-terminal domain-containing protein [Rhodobacteraceae bacterium]|nr:filamentous hemagglutinin N-terminal domain-containing protein [Paracoccaceae bacterium]